MWSVALCGSQTWPVNKRDRQRTKVFEILCWERITKKVDGQVGNEGVLRRVNENRGVSKVINRRRKGHLIRHDDYLNTGKNRWKGRKGKAKENILALSGDRTRARSYQGTKKLAE